MSKDSVLRPVVWMGDSKKQLKKMPEDVQKQMGGELYLAQRGEGPPHSKMLKGLGSGVFEIRDDFDSNTYRLVYAVQIGKRLYVLHAFQKKSKKGIATPPRDVELITRRYKGSGRLGKGVADMKKRNTRDYEVSSGNVFADLGLKDSESLLMRAELGHQILRILKSRGLKKQKDVQDLLDIGQTEVSHLMNARYHRFSEARLMAFLNKLDRKVTVQVSRRRKNEPLQEVVLA